MHLLSLRDLTKSYAPPPGVGGGPQRVLDVAEFDLAPGEQVALAGRSGSGKTTLLNVIAGLVRPDAGSVRYGEVELTSLSEGQRDRFRARHLGYVFQTFNLLQGYTALENVLLGMLFGPGRDRAWAVELLERLGLGERLHYKPAQLSVGQQQRVALARGLANRPKLLLADEPTGNLDPASADEALELIRGLCRETEAALLLVSHDQAVLDGFERSLDLSELNRASRAAQAKAEASR